MVKICNKLLKALWTLLFSCFIIIYDAEKRHTSPHIKHLAGGMGLLPAEFCRSPKSCQECQLALACDSLVPMCPTHQGNTNGSHSNLDYHLPLAFLVFLKDSLVSSPTFPIISLPWFFWLDGSSVVLRPVCGWVCLDHIFGWCITHHVCSLAPTNKTLKRFLKRLRKFFGYQTAFIKITFLWLKM